MNTFFFYLFFFVYVNYIRPIRVRILRNWIGFDLIKDIVTAINVIVELSFLSVRDQSVCTVKFTTLLADIWFIYPIYNICSKKY